MQSYEVVIIGSGFSGICSAIKLIENGITNFTILERDTELGGTWWKNTYPGAAVDVPSHLYSFSFEPYDWTRFFAKQSEILAYTKQIISKYQLKAKAECNVQIEELRYLEDTGHWEVKFADKETISAQFIISGTGSLSQAHIPDIDGLETFKGTHFHSSEWNHEFDYSNKRVGVIGTGASAVQLVPELAKTTKKLTVLQRTAHWVLPRPDRLLKTWERKLLKRPFFNAFFRGLTYLKSESRAIFFTKLPGLAKVVKLESLLHLKKHIKDEKLRNNLIPNYDIGCKRVLLSNDYYPTFNRENVHLETEAIKAIKPEGIQFEDGSTLALDLIVFATGFHAAENAIPFSVVGRNGISLEKHWQDGAFAYYGTMVSQFPNLFFVMGPNTGTGHTSVIYFIESQMAYIMDALRKAKKNQWKSIEIKEQVEQAFNAKLQEDLKGTIWQKGGCKSWYQTSTGKNTTMFPNFSFIFRRNIRSFKTELHKTL